MLTKPVTSYMLIVLACNRFFMKHVYKGGRGIKAPYKSKVVRVPEPVLGEVEKLVNSFYDQEGGEGEEQRLIQVNEAILRAKEILAQNQISKRPTKHCIEKLLQALYGDESIKL
jgi:hypothetical protein